MDDEERARQVVWQWVAPSLPETLSTVASQRELKRIIAAAIRAAVAEALADERAAIIATLEADIAAQDDIVRRAQDEGRWRIVNHALSRIAGFEEAISDIRERARESGTNGAS